MRSRPSLSRRACSTSLRRATEAPPGCSVSHAQWRGSRVTSRATTPSFGRPGPRRALFSGPAGTDTGTAALASRFSRSAAVPRKSRSIGSLVTASNRRIGSRPRSSTSFALKATSARSPAAMQRAPAKAMQRVSFRSSMARFLREGSVDAILPGRNWRVNITRIKRANEPRPLARLVAVDAAPISGTPRENGEGMIERVIDFLTGRAPPLLTASADALATAVAALLIEAARMDDDFNAAERAAIERLLAERFALAPAAVQALVDDAEAAVRHSTQFFPFTQQICRQLDPEARVRIIEMLWEVAYADGILDAQEDMLLRRIAGLIYVSDGERGAARKRALEKLAAAQGRDGGGA